MNKILSILLFSLTMVVEEVLVCTTCIGGMAPCTDAYVMHLLPRINLKHKYTLLTWSHTNNLLTYYNTCNPACYTWYNVSIQIKMPKAISQNICIYVGHYYTN